VKRPVGGRWKKLKAAALATLVSTPSHSPQIVDTSRTASRYATPLEAAGETSRSGKIRPVIAATANAATTRPTKTDGGSEPSRRDARSRTR
jgi:hypothetical protein